ncbi:hypothetical protein P8452_63595 [Trifolium repens]|nr:hypothetical protein P8452_63595 [Trifolium repens]
MIHHLSSDDDPVIILQYCKTNYDCSDIHCHPPQVGKCLYNLCDCGRCETTHRPGRVTAFCKINLKYFKAFTVVEFVAARLMMIVQIIFVVFRKLEIVFLIIVIAINRERGTTQDKPLVHIQLLYSIFVQTQIK